MNSYQDKIYDILNQLIDQKIDIIYDQDYVKQILGANYKDVINLCAKRIYDNKKQFLYENHQEEIKLYQEFKNTILDLFTSLSFNEDLVRAFALEYMINHGFLSADKRFKKDNPIYKNLLDNNGMNIVLGEGVCRNYASLFHELYQNNSLIYGVISENNDPYLLEKQQTNHVINLINYHNRFYGIDIMNKVIFNFVHWYLLKSLSHPEYYMLYKSYADLFLSNKSIYKIENDLENNYPSELIISDYIQDKREIYKMLKGKNANFEKFHQDTNTLKCEIKKKMLSKI